MKEFLRKNKLLTTVIVLTAIISVGLIFVAYTLFRDISKSITTINNGKKELDAINNKTNPNNVEASAEAILEDKEVLAQIVAANQYKFGRFHNAAINKFIRMVEAVPASETSVDGIAIKAIKDYSSKFSGVYNSFISSLGSSLGSQKLLNIDQQRELFNKFRELIVADNAEKAALFDQAFQDFKSDVKKTTIEDVTDDVAAAFFMQALGLSRSMTSYECLNYSNNMISLFAANDFVPYSSSSKSRYGAYSGESNSKEYPVKRFMMLLDDKQAANSLTVPPESNVKLYVRRFQIFEPLFAALKESAKIKSSPDEPEMRVVSHSVQSSSMYGDRFPENPDFVYFEFKLELLCTLPQLRDFISRLHKSVESGHFFAVKNLTLKTEGANEPVTAAKISLDNLALKERIKTAKEEGKNTDMLGRPGPRGGRPGDPDRIYSASADPNALPDDYGAVRIGRDKLINVTLVYNYIIYEGDDIK